MPRLKTVTEFNAAASVAGSPEARIRDAGVRLAQHYETFANRAKAQEQLERLLASPSTSKHQKARFQKFLDVTNSELAMEAELGAELSFELMDAKVDAVSGDLD